MVEAADQEQVADREISRMRGVGAIAVAIEHRARRIERLRRPAEIARDERDLRLGDHAARAGDRLPRAEGACGAPQQRPGADKIAELRHRDAAQRQRRRIVAQGDEVECAERITRGERARRGCDQRVHSNPDTLVTPGRPTAGRKSIPSINARQAAAANAADARASKGETR